LSILLLLGPQIALATQAVDTTGVIPAAEDLLKARFQQAEVTYPPERIQLIAVKAAKRLELWAWSNRNWRHIHDYPIFAASGVNGPKLREGDKQVPEGFYLIVALNPNSKFHLSLKLNYPNSFDWQHAVAEGRETPGSDIFIHGSAWSVGCLAIGNRNVEELYSLVSRIGLEQAQVLIAPYDFRAKAYSVSLKQPPWLEQLYGYLNVRMRQFPLAKKSYTCSPKCLGQ
jgi:murein L,D-transpeptidase YafK